MNCFLLDCVYKIKSLQIIVNDVRMSYVIWQDQINGSQKDFQNFLKDCLFFLKYYFRNVYILTWKIINKQS